MARRVEGVGERERESLRRGSSSAAHASHPLCIVLCPLSAAHHGARVALESGGHDAKRDGNYAYVPTQLFDSVQPEDVPASLPPLARRRLRMMSAIDNNNSELGNIYIGNCQEPMAWAGEHVGYIIDASHGRSNVFCLINQYSPFHLCRPVLCPMSHMSHRVFGVFGVTSEELRMECGLRTAVALHHQGSATSRRRLAGTP